MSNPKDLYKQWHPEQFSDSEMIKKADLDRDFFDYYLSTLTAKNLEKDFELFCRRMIESEICPNLLPQTGPTGGGDSKVDSETYPVSDELAITWYYGENNKAATERWAFAFSAKKDWKSKAKSDIEKIVETNKSGRNYSKVFFVSNQSISDKKRAELEDLYRNTYCIDVRILDKTWLVERVFTSDNNKQIACETLGLSEHFLDDRRIGAQDYKRSLRISEIEARLKEIDECKQSEMVSLTRECVVLSRELEVDHQRMLGLIDRCVRFAKQYGFNTDLFDSYYESAWTLFWWYSDYQGFYEYFELLEKMLWEDRKIYYFERYTALWINVYSLHASGDLIIDIKKHNNVVDSLFQEFISEKDKPNTVMRAKLAYQHIRFLRGESVDSIVETYISIVRESETSLEIDVSQIKEIVTRLPMFQNATRYEELFELLLKRLSKEKEQTVVSIMLAKRGSSLINSPTKALGYFNRALMGFYNESNTDNLIRVVLQIAMCFEKLGLFWAARNYYYYVFSYCLNQYEDKGVVSPALRISAHLLKWIEWQLGRIMYSAEMSYYEKIALSIDPTEIDGDDDHFELLLAMLLFKSDFSLIKQTKRLPGYLDSKGLEFTSIASRYELGIYDDMFLSSLNGSKEEFDQYMYNWCNSPAWNQVLYEPWYGFEGTCVIKSRIMGCEFIVTTDGTAFVSELATSVLAALECFLGTGFANGILSLASVFEIDIISVNAADSAVNVVHTRENPTYMRIELCDCDKLKNAELQEVYSEKLLIIISTVVSVILRDNNDFIKLKQLVEQEETIVGIELFATSLFYGYATFGPNAFDYSYLTSGFEEEPLLRTEKVLLKEPDKTVREDFSEGKIIFDQPYNYDLSKIGNDKIITSNVINVPLWDQSRWKGVGYSIGLKNKPVLWLIFETNSGVKIFDDWINAYGNIDENNSIGLRIIKQIDKDNLHWYRIGIGPSSFQQMKAAEGNVIISPVRMHTMQPDNDENLSNFEKALQLSDSFYMCPATFDEKSHNLISHLDKSILKKKESIVITFAYELKESDLISESSILPSDNPLIPEGIFNTDIERIIKRKKSNSENKNTAS